MTKFVAPDGTLTAKFCEELAAPDKPVMRNGSTEGIVVNVAVTFLASDMVTLQVALVPLQLPDHPPNELPPAAAAVKVTLVLAA